MAHLPVTLSQNFTIDLYNTKNAELVVYQGPKFTLGQILSGIIWELGRSGSPERRDRIRREIELSIAQNS
jgi:hypothetical protein